MVVYLLLLELDVSLQGREESGVLGEVTQHQSGLVVHRRCVRWDWTGLGLYTNGVVGWSLLSNCISGLMEEVGTPSPAKLLVQ